MRSAAVIKSLQGIDASQVLGLVSQLKTSGYQFSIFRWHPPDSEPMELMEMYVLLEYQELSGVA